MAVPTPAPYLNASEIPTPHHFRMRDASNEDVRRIIAGIAAGAGDGAEELRRAGIPVELEGFVIEAMVEPGDRSPATSVRLVFCKEPRVKNQDPIPDGS